MAAKATANATAAHQVLAKQHGLQVMPEEALTSE
jgi:hypothetical protein